jgi:hypothetical protein
MPHCVICNTRIYGSGHYCSLHKPKFRRSHTQEYYNYSSDSTYPGETHFRTSAGTTGTVARRRHNNDTTNNAVALYSSNAAGQISIDRPAVDMPLAYMLAQSFAALQETHIINSVTYCVTPSGAQTLNVDANLDRDQCPTCRVWFANREKLDDHRLEYPVGCEIHALCMRSEDTLWHGTDRRHDRCFVRGCLSPYRTEGSWRTSAVERHVRSCHYC